MKYYIEVRRVFRLCVEAENPDDAQQFALENAEAVKNGIADDETTIILEIDGKEVKQ